MLPLTIHIHERTPIHTQGRGTGAKSIAACRKHGMTVQQRIASAQSLALGLPCIAANISSLPHPRSSEHGIETRTQEPSRNEGRKKTPCTSQHPSWFLSLTHMQEIAFTASPPRVHFCHKLYRWKCSVLFAFFFAVSAGLMLRQGS